MYLGDCAVVDKYLSDKPVRQPQWAVAHFFNTFLRAVGQVGGAAEHDYHHGVERNGRRHEMYFGKDLHTAYRP